jgi:hypothetical protein
LPPARTQALRGGRAVVGTLVLAEEDILELHHPEFTKSSVGSFAGTSEDDGTIACPRSSKYFEEACADIGGFHRYNRSSGSRAGRLNFFARRKMSNR